KEISTLTLCHEKKQIEIVVNALNEAVAKNSGIWQWLSGSTLIIAIWGEFTQAENTLRDLMKFINTTLKQACYAGAAIFPFMDFSPEMALSNAVKALDHSAFFAPGTTTFFDDVTQNICGDRLYQLGKVELAAIEYEKGLEIRSDNLNMLNSLGVCYSIMNRLDLARRQFEKAIVFQRDTQLRQDNLKQGNILNKSDQPEKYGEFKQAGQSEKYGEFKQTDKPEKDGKNKQVDHPEFYENVDDNEFMLLYNAALISNLMNDVENGISYIRKATSINKDFFESELTAGILLLKANITDEALLHIENAVNLNSDSGIAHRILGELYMKTNLPAKAVHAYTRAVKLNPSDACAISGLARAFEVQNKNLDLALDLALHSLIIAPENPWFRIRLAKIYMKRGERDFADIEFAKAGEFFKHEIQDFKQEIHDNSSLLSGSPDTISVSDIKTDGVEIENLFEYQDNKTTVLKKKSA
ncbi:MAG: tetratricopeptide repeat protein, partial [Desulfamplus sp.]|nr:tetratricopeptide repeat protein [Desulfamplus sp.]